MGIKPTCIREQHDAAVRNARFQLLKAFAKYSDMISRENALPTDPKHAATLMIGCEVKMSPAVGGEHGKLRLDKPDVACVGHNQDTMKWVSHSFAEANGREGRKRALYNTTVLFADEDDCLLATTIDTHIVSNKVKGLHQQQYPQMFVLLNLATKYKGIEKMRMKLIINNIHCFY
eukprot:scaffold74058_cov60-Attheya_sp.AAC.4